ncbi:hard surface induced [Fusarium agapanthi]|uniref:Hard surface induced n=1 Tax=Fusarium agapanthi TaxID=1803897 RepID=A0A9P5EAW7_9HYPO|nr:hard surface induced [Fusarium agapanthi]
MATTTVRKDHKKWKCNKNISGKRCDTDNEMSDIYCSTCDKRRQTDDEALAADGSSIGRLYHLALDLTEHWEYTSSPEPL